MNIHIATVINNTHNLHNIQTLKLQVELFLRLAATGCDFFCSSDWRWNLLDLVIVCLVVEP